MKTASPDYYADVQEWLDDIASKSGNYTFAVYYAGTLKARYFLDGGECLKSVSDTTTETADAAECMFRV